MAADPDDWLDALAGRAPAGTSVEADQLRQALLPLPAEAVVNGGWDAVVAAAAASTPSTVGAPGSLEVSAPAANQPRYRAPLAWAAVLAIAVGLGMWWPRPDEAPALRGAPAHEGATWLTPDPAGQSRALAAELQQAGALVSVQASGTAWVLHIQADAAARAAVDVRLQLLETGLDAQGRLVLTVRDGR